MAVAVSKIASPYRRLVAGVPAPERAAAERAGQAAGPGGGEEAAVEGGQPVEVARLPSTDSNRFDAVNASERALLRARRRHPPHPAAVGGAQPEPSNGDAYNRTSTRSHRCVSLQVDNDNPPETCDSACQTRESLFTTHGYSSGNSTPSHSAHADSPPAPFSTFGYKKDNSKFKAEARIEMAPQQQQHAAGKGPNKFDDKRRPYSVQTTKSAPDVIVTH
ncbi:hypothetical protein NQ318_005179 [Aromia moschata]|uniref:Uncharacterized protein n=1 Tax=Aromia moschata TaxID=1265417 RepID=A0AAV8XHU1_9CUCU|nr:hypothetical protein NQ318_005179 [Aromia moschata]